MWWVTTRFSGTHITQASYKQAHVSARPHWLRLSHSGLAPSCAKNVLFALNPLACSLRLRLAQQIPDNASSLKYSTRTLGQKRYLLHILSQNNIFASKVAAARDGFNGFVCRWLLQTALTASSCSLPQSQQWVAIHQKYWTFSNLIGTELFPLCSRSIFPTNTNRNVSDPTYLP